MKDSNKEVGCSFGSSKFIDIDEKISHIEERLDAGAAKMTSIYWFGILGIVLGVTKIIIDLVK